MQGKPESQSARHGDTLKAPATFWPSPNKVHPTRSDNILDSSDKVLDSATQPAPGPTRSDFILDSRGNMLDSSDNMLDSAAQSAPGLAELHITPRPSGSHHLTDAQNAPHGHTLGYLQPTCCTRKPTQTQMAAWSDIRSHSMYRQALHPGRNTGPLFSTSNAGPPCAGCWLTAQEEGSSSGVQLTTNASNYGVIQCARPVSEQSGACNDVAPDWSQGSGGSELGDISPSCMGTSAACDAARRGNGSGQLQGAERQMTPYTVSMLSPTKFHAAAVAAGCEYPGRISGAQVRLLHSESPRCMLCNRFPGSVRLFAPLQGPCAYVRIHRVCSSLKYERVVKSCSCGPAGTKCIRRAGSCIEQRGGCRRSTQSWPQE